MLDVYKRMEAEGKIGKFYRDIDGSLKAKPFAEFPKTVRLHGPDGKTVERVVNSAREELALQSFEPGVADADPVVKERNELLEMVAERDAKAQAKDEQVAKMQAEIDEMRRLLVTRPPLPSDSD